MEQIDLSLDKLQIASARLADTICGFYDRHHQTTIIDNARAIMELIDGIAKYYYKQGKTKTIGSYGLENPDEYWVTDDQRKQTRLLSNFAKHSDRDPLSVQTDYLLEYASDSLLSTCMDYVQLIGILENHDLIERQKNSTLPMGNGDEFRGTKTDVLCTLYLNWSYRKKLANDALAEEYDRVLEETGSRIIDPEDHPKQFGLLQEKLHEVNDFYMSGIDTYNAYIRENKFNQHPEKPEIRLLEAEKPTSGYVIVFK